MIKKKMKGIYILTIVISTMIMVFFAIFIAIQVKKYETIKETTISEVETLQEKVFSVSELAREHVYKIVIEPIGSKEEVINGSGFSFEYNGEVYILTNHHIIDGKSNIKAYSKDEELYPVNVFLEDKEKDIAILKTTEEKIKKGLTLGDSKKVHIGEFILSAGNPYQFHHSVFFGIISAKRYDTKIEEKIHDELFQMDAAVNPGSSGGPVLNLNGEVIGMNVGNVPKAENIGFAVPIHEVKKLLEEKK